MINLKEKILDGVRKSLETFSIDKLSEVIRKSEKEKREYGLLFCGSTDVPPFGDLSHAGLCTGEKCSVEINDCKDKIRIGTFHTHPRVEEGTNFGNLSGNDVYMSIYHRQIFSCIGLMEHNRPIIKCFIPTFEIDPTIALNAYNAEDDYGKKLSKVISERGQNRKSVDELAEAYDKRVIANNDLHRESEALADRLLSKKADLVIKGDKHANM